MLKDQKNDIKNLPSNVFVHFEDHLSYIQDNVIDKKGYGDDFINYDL